MLFINLGGGRNENNSYLVTDIWWKLHCEKAGKIESKAWQLNCTFLAWSWWFLCGGYLLNAEPKNEKSNIDQECCIYEKSYFQGKIEKAEVKTKAMIGNENEQDSIITEKPSVPVVSGDEDDGELDDADESLDSEKKDKDNYFTVVPNKETKMNTILILAVKNLETLHNPDATKLVEGVIKKKQIITKQEVCGSVGYAHT